MNLLETLSLVPRKKERDEFLGSSLTFSRLVSERIFAESESESNDRGRLFTMNFRSEWQHTNCPAMAWYSQQRQSSTRFQLVEHCKTLDGPFYHEFLLIKLTDGAVCRVERTGEGSRSDAVRYIGCTAHDFIQWFSRVDYDSFSANSPSERIAEVDLSQEFDLLDVLAICYSIQNNKRCRAYTLQRYNCYFLCLTVLAALSRRVTSWETKIELDYWDSRLDSMLVELSHPPPEESQIWDICHMHPS